MTFNINSSDNYQRRYLARHLSCMPWFVAWTHWDSWNMATGQRHHGCLCPWLSKMVHEGFYLPPDYLNTKILVNWLSDLTVKWTNRVIVMGMDMEISGEMLLSCGNMQAHRSKITIFWIWEQHRNEYNITLRLDDDHHMHYSHRRHLHVSIFSHADMKLTRQRPLLLTRIDFNPIMDK